MPFISFCWWLANRAAASSGELGLIKLSVVLKLGVRESELDVESSTRAPKRSFICQLLPRLNILLSVKREFVSPEKRRLPSLPSASSGITPRTAASILPRFWVPLEPSREPKLTVSKASGAAISRRPEMPDAWILELS